MQSGVSRTAGNVAEDRIIAVIESTCSHERIHDSEDFEKHARWPCSSHAAKEKDRSGSEMDDIVCEVYVEDTKEHRHAVHVVRRGRDESKNADKQEDQTEENRGCFYHFGLQLVKTPTLMAVAPYAGKLKTAKRKADHAV